MKLRPCSISRAGDWARGLLAGLAAALSSCGVESPAPADLRTPPSPEPPSWHEAAPAEVAFALRYPQREAGLTTARQAAELAGRPSLWRDAPGAGAPGAWPLAVFAGQPDTDGGRRPIGAVYVSEDGAGLTWQAAHGPEAWTERVARAVTTYLDRSRPSAWEGFISKETLAELWPALARYVPETQQGPPEARIHFRLAQERKGIRFEADLPALSQSSSPAPHLPAGSGSYISLQRSAVLARALRRTLHSLAEEAGDPGLARTLDALANLDHDIALELIENGQAAPGWACRILGDPKRIETALAWLPITPAAPDAGGHWSLALPEAIRIRPQEEGLLLTSAATARPAAARAPQGDLRAAIRLQFAEAAPLLEDLRALDGLPPWAWRAAARYDALEITEHARPRGVQLSLVLTRGASATRP